MDPLAEEKKKLEEAVVETMITALEKEKITEEELPTISNFVLDKVDSAQNIHDLEVFLEELVKKWEIFQPLLVLEKAEKQEKFEEEITQGVLALMEHGKLDHAIKLAQSATKPKDEQTDKQ
jgi:acyl-CoA reductase-like NAD-dependent aldehyde dehydrogenase